VHKRIFLAGLSLAALASPVRAQDVAPTPTPTPGVIPGVVPERFTLGPPVAVTPVPLPSPTPTAAPPPRAAPTSASERVVPRPTPTPAASPVVAASPASAPVPAMPTPVATAAPAPRATASATPATVPAPAPQPAREGLPIWLWALAGLGLAALAFAAYRLLRVKPTEEAQPIAEPVAAAPPPPPRPRPAPVTAAPVADPFELALQPQRITLAEREVVLELELMIGNRQPHGAEGIRVQAVPISANPDQDRQLAAFHAGPFIDSGAPPFDLPVGGGGRMPVRIALPRDRLHVVQVGNRPMFVPMVLVDVRWRAGLGLKRFGADFMLGTQGQGGKLGPIWLDRQPSGQLAATRYVARITAAA
jgi:hypothetical protein